MDNDGSYYGSSSDIDDGMEERRQMKCINVVYNYTVDYPRKHNRHWYCLDYRPPR